MRAIHIRTEYLKDPIGIDIKHPRIFWNCEGGTKQTAYEIDCGGRSTGKTETDSMQHVWTDELSSGERVEFRIRLWDENGEPGDWSELSFFEAGLLEPGDWKAQWITGDYDPDRSEWRRKQIFGRSMLLNGVDFLFRSRKPENIERYPADCFRRRFEVEGEVRRARLYITACGLYEARINGAKAGDQVLTPGYTDYRKRIQYQTFDVTGLIKSGENLLDVDLADGWYRGSVGAWGLKQEYGYETKLLAQLEIETGDGGKQTVVSDGSWSWSNDGPVRFADNKDGEIVDARLTPSYGWNAKVTGCDVVPSASDNVGVKEQETFTPSVITTPSGKTVLDMGQNFAGYISFSLTAEAGDRIVLRFGEMLDGSGEFTQKNIQVSNSHITTPLQRVIYTCKKGLNEYKTRFAVFGYQYVLVESDVPVDPAQFTGIAVYSDMERTGYFRSSNELLDRFVDAVVWSAKSNSLDIPTDCPTRERHGWTGDAQIFYDSASYLFDYAAFGRKYLNDLYDWQKDSGLLPQIAPEGGTDFYMDRMNGSPGWSDAGILIPWRFSRKYADRRILEDLYEGMKKYADFLITRIGKNDLLSAKNPVKGEKRRYIVNSGQAYGEWAEPRDVYPNNWTNVVLPEMEVSTAYTSHVLKLMSRISQELGKEEDAARFLDWSEKTRTGYQALVSTEEFSLDTDRQARLVRPLYFGLLDEKQDAYARERLIRAMENYGWRLGTGFLSTPQILHVLKDIDTEAAYRLLENDEIPGWLSMPRNGATTIWEDWEGKNAQAGIASLNHYSKGASIEWLFSCMCGIEIAGENRFRIAPVPGGHFTHAQAEYQSIFGKVTSGWEKTSGGWRYKVTVPANCTAEVILPGGTAVTQGAGTAEYEEVES